jgi:hypothetical protein
LYLQSLLTIIPRELFELRTTFTEKENELFPLILASEEITTNHEKAICNCNSPVCVFILMEVQSTQYYDFSFLNEEHLTSTKYSSKRSLIQSNHTISYSNRLYNPGLNMAASAEVRRNRNDNIADDINTPVPEVDADVRRGPHILFGYGGQIRSTRCHT